MNQARKLLALAVACVLLATVACDQLDILARDRVKVEGAVTGPDLDDPDKTIAVEDVWVEFPRNPGDNTADELSTATGADGRYALRVDIRKDWCVPVRFFQYGYYEQDRMVCDSPTDQEFNVRLRSAYDYAASKNCHSICARYLECQEIWDVTYTDLAQCEAHCAQGCNTVRYLSCAYSYDVSTGFNLSDKCVELWDCYKAQCDEEWLDSGDDTAGDDTGN
jgi:hypothetical protein